MNQRHCYEFRAVDRPLSGPELAELGELRHDELTKRGFRVTLGLFNLPVEPRELLRRHFDVFLYAAEWAERRFMLRLPRSQFDAESAREYEAGEYFSVEEPGDDVILSFDWREEEYEFPIGPQWMPELLPVRAALLAGDRRPLYLGWLLGVQCRAVEESAPEPEVPPGLGELDEALSALVDFLDIEIDLVAAAAENSRPADPAAVRRDVAGWISGLGPEEREDLLVRLIAGDGDGLAPQMRQRALRAGDRARESRSRRTSAELLARGEELRRRRMEKVRQASRRRQREESEERERRRREHLESLRPRVDELWREVEALVATTLKRRYIRAVDMLADLRDLAELDGNRAEFAARLRDFLARHSNRPALLLRVGEARLQD